ncbi:hypothetical protein Aph01nite_34320 [Acrocarpospora phusangensis]|uniref:Uncharacterized protein n=1 Tax=Acrocarpospora phusangensis TaxID=1070424 RepID=A0A919QF57_9ACTN|nr:hypothetical protein [Acrocarpospora phusangensis]GIH25122.1 hypothetical protein Aph01nite_34320 [Acrocarpospora phusangensis]
MTTPQCQTFAWCIEPDGHERRAEPTVHWRKLAALESRTGALHVEVSLRGDAEREHVHLVLSDGYLGPAVRQTFDLADDLAEALGSLLLTLSPDDTLKFGEALMHGGLAIGGRW